MARSPDRRPGFSRRAQYGIFTGYVIAVAGFLAGAGLLIVSIVNPQAFSSVRGAASEIARPAGEAGAETRAAGQSVIAAIGAYSRPGGRTRRFPAKSPPRGPMRSPCRRWKTRTGG